jgi:hypothetical protein
MSAAADRDDLDQELAAEGSDAELVRVTGTTNQIRFTAAVRAYARGYFPRELGNEIIQGDTKVIISPTDIERAQWPGAQVLNSVGDNRVPRRGDKIVIQGRERMIMAATPFYIDGELVRLELQARGQNP